MFSIAREQDHHGALEWRADVGCPVCGRTNDNCKVGIDPGGIIKFAYCGRIEEGSTGKQNAGGQFLHIIDDGDDRPPVIVPPKPKRDPAEFASHLRTLQYFQECPLVERNRQWILSGLESTTGISSSAWRAIGATWFAPGIAQLPEKNANSEVVGIGTRVIRTGAKYMAPGSSHGLIYADSLLAMRDLRQVLLVEGASDTAACWEMGIAAIGSPNNFMVCDAPELIGMATAMAWGDDVELIVVGERDRKVDGKFPGRDGAIRRAQQLAKRLPGMTIRAVLPPDGFKDVRAFHNSQSKEAIADGSSRLQLLSGLVPIESDIRRKQVVPVASSSAPHPHEHSPDCGCSTCAADHLDDDGDLRRCPRAATASMANKETGHLRIQRVSCKTWACDYCRRRILIPKWREHSGAKLKPGSNYYRIVVTDREWESVRRKISRRFGQYIRVPMASGLIISGVRSKAVVWAVYTNVAITGADLLSEELSGEDAQQRAAADISLCTQKISTSRGWKLPDPQEPKYKRIEKNVPFDRRAAAKVAQELVWKTRDWKKTEHGIECVIDFDAGKDISFGEACEAHARYMELARWPRPNLSVPETRLQGDWDTQPTAHARSTALEMRRLPLKLTG